MLRLSPNRRWASLFAISSLVCFSGCGKQEPVKAQSALPVLERENICAGNPPENGRQAVFRQDLTVRFAGETGKVVVKNDSRLPVLFSLHSAASKAKVLSMVTHALSSSVTSLAPGAYPVSFSSGKLWCGFSDGFGEINTYGYHFPIIVRAGYSLLVEVVDSPSSPIGISTRFSYLGTTRVSPFGPAELLQ